MRDGPSNEERVRIGLCADCQWTRRQPSTRGSVFYRCGLADVEPSRMRYPPIPVQRCSGYAPEEEPGP